MLTGASRAAAMVATVRENCTPARSIRQGKRPSSRGAHRRTPDRSVASSAGLRTSQESGPELAPSWPPGKGKLHESLDHRARATSSMNHSWSSELDVMQVLSRKVHPKCFCFTLTFVAVVATLNVGCNAGVV